MAANIRVTCWNEFRHEKKHEKIAEIYPLGMHAAIAEHLAAAGGVTTRAPEVPCSRLREHARFTNHGQNAMSQQRTAANRAAVAPNAYGWRRSSRTIFAQARSA